MSVWLASEPSEGYRAVVGLVGLDKLPNPTSPGYPRDGGRDTLATLATLGMSRMGDTLAMLATLGMGNTLTSYAGYPGMEGMGNTLATLATLW